jgi:L-lysine exporter family protein LysE/ArgO
VPSFSFAPYLQGLGLGAGLIIAIGAQNAYVLRQGLLRQHVFAIASICTLCDMILISLGVGGLGALISGAPLWLNLAAWGGAAFLLAYGARSFHSALHPSTLDAGENSPSPAGRREAVLAALAFSLLNPHVYLDTVVLVGSIGAQHPLPERPFFAMGAMTASVLWFYGLAYGAAWLAPLFRRPAAWRILDFVIGGIMWAIAASLIIASLAAKG